MFHIFLRIKSQLLNLAYKAPHYPGRDNFLTLSLAKLSLAYHALSTRISLFFPKHTNHALISVLLHWVVPRPFFHQQAHSLICDAFLNATLSERTFQSPQSKHSTLSHLLAPDILCFICFSHWSCMRSYYSVYRDQNNVGFKSAHITIEGVNHCHILS